MTTKAGYKTKLFLALAITAVVCVTLPFLAYNQKTVIAVYPSKPEMNTNEKSLVTALKGEGYDVKIAPKKQHAVDVAIWFRTPETVSEVTASTAKYNFMYSDAHYPFDWYKIPNPPIVLTPYNDLYEHYVRSNLKAALMPQLTTNTAPTASQKLKEIINWLEEND